MKISTTTRFISVPGLCLVLALAAVGPAWGQRLNPEKAITQYLQTAWNTSAGLPQSSVHAVAQTTDGYLWLGTEEGLARFDGVHFTVFTRRTTPGLASDYIQTLRATTDGSLWIGTDSGLSHLLPRSHGSETLTFQKLTEADGLASSSINTICEDREHALWIGTPHGLNRIRNGHIDTWTVSDGLPEAGVRALALDASGALWVGTAKGLAKIEQGRVTAVLNRSDGLPGDSVTGIAAAPDGSVWVAMVADHLAHIEHGRLSVVPVRLPWSEIMALQADREGSVWIAFDHHGIGRLYRNRLERYNTSQGLPSDRCSRALFEDREGSLWLGLLDAGVIQLRDSKFTVYGKPEGLSGNYIDAVLQAADGSMWIGADTDGIDHLLPDGRVEHWNQHRGLPNSEVYALLQARDGSLWAGYRNGTLARIRNRQVTVYHDPEAADAGVLALYEDRDGSILIGYSGRGLAVFRKGTFQHLKRGGSIRGIARTPDGALWLGIDGEGVERRDGDEVRRYTEADGLAGIHIMCLSLDPDGTLWAGTAAGLSRIRDGKILSWTPSQGLPDSAVGSVIRDDSGDLWIGGDSGILRIPGSELNGNTVSTLHPVRYDTWDGLRSRETLYGTTPSAWKARDGRLWFTTIAGVAVIDPAHIPINRVVPPVWIEKVSFNARAISWESGSPLGPGAGNLEVFFTAPSFVAPQQVQFRYRLVGFDQDWVYAGSRHNAWYTNLQPGRYTFEVQAENSDGIWNHRGASFRFTVRPLPTRTPLAIFCYVSLALALIWMLMAFRTRSLIRRQEELTELVAERTAQLEAEKAALESARHELHIRATHDSLTGLLNRAAILDSLQRELSRANREKAPLAVVIADLDHFKNLNDNYGHLCGDDAIRETAERFLSVMRDYDLAGRYGGEEFLMLFPGLDPRQSPERIEELLEAIRSRPFTLGSAEVILTCSIGVTTYLPECKMPTVREVLSQADCALYAAKKAGRNRSVVEVYSCP